jgi:hypothetical protein
MMSEHITILKPPQPTTDAIAFSNSIRLSGWQWLAVVLFAIVIILLAPRLWQLAEEFPFEDDYRIPFDLKEDYWLYERFAGLAVEQSDALVIGDSVVWGVFVKRDETLSFYLSERTGKKVSNLGLIGAHPLALSGLVRHYAGSVRDKPVLLQCNPLWLTSKAQDLQDKDEPRDLFHERLLPQFWPAIPRNQAEISDRLGIVAEQHSTFRGWTRHLQQAYYDQKDIPSWTLKHPYENPLAPLGNDLPGSDNTLRQQPIPWFKRDKTLQDFDWIDLDTSLQWQAFQRTVDILQKRGNRVFVLVGPFNEHMLTPASRERYQKVKVTISAWLKANDVPHLIPDALPSALYGDASHPLAAGYEKLARQVAEVSAYRKTLKENHENTK